jgi:hypothetical protein
VNLWWAARRSAVPKGLGSVDGGDRPKFSEKYTFEADLIGMKMWIDMLVIDQWMRGRGNERHGRSEGGDSTCLKIEFHDARGRG